MRLGRILLLVALVAILGLAAIFFLTNRGGGGTQGLTDEQVLATEQAQETIPVVFLQQPVNRGETIALEKLGIKNLPKIEVPEVYFSDLTEVAGQISRFNLEQGTFVTEGMILTDLDTSSDSGSIHATLIPEGMVAFPVPISRFSSVAYGITKGDRVDVIVTMAFVDLDTQFQSITPNQTAGVLAPGSSSIIQNDPEGGSLVEGVIADLFNNIVAQSASGGTISPQGRAELDALLNQQFYYVPSEAQRSRVVSQMIMQNLVVLNLGDFPLYNEKGQEAVVATPTPLGAEAEQADGEAATTTQQITVLPPDTVTLIMWPQEAVTLNYLLYTGAELTLALRSAGDGSQTATDAVTLQYLMDVYRIPLPVRLPYGTQPRIDELKAPLLENDALLENQ